MGSAWLRLRGSWNNHRLGQEGNLDRDSFATPPEGSSLTEWDSIMMGRTQWLLIGAGGRRGDGRIPIGINIGKSRSTPPDQAPDDYSQPDCKQVWRLFRQLTRPGCAIFRRPSVCNRSFASASGDARKAAAGQDRTGSRRPASS